MIARLGITAMGLALGLVTALAVAELALRLFDLQAVGGLATVTKEEFGRVPGLFSPGQSVVDRTNLKLPFHVTVDSLGYRAVEELDRVKPRNETRVLLLGDSFTFGYLVDDENTMPSQLERQLQSQCDRRIRVINAGVGGTTIVTAAEMAERSLELDIDLAVLTFTENDITDLASPLWYQLERNREAKSVFPLSVVYPVARHLALWNLLLTVRSKWNNLRHGKPRSEVVPQANAKGPTTGPRSGLREEYRDRLHRMNERLGRAGVPLIVAIYPSHLTVYGNGHDDQVRWIESTAQAEGVGVVNFTDTLRLDGRPQEELYLLPRDGHPSAEGYRVVTPILADSVLSVLTRQSLCSLEAGSIRNSNRENPS